MEVGRFPHRIKRNELTRIPRRHICFDTEAQQVEERGKRVQSFRCAVAVCDYQYKKGRPWHTDGPESFTDPRALWEWISDRTEPKKRTVAVAHNLAYDLRIAQAFTILPELGWRLDMIRLDGGQTWCQWRRDGATLSLIDSMSWFNTSLDNIGKLEGVPKLALPRWDAPVSEWLARCAADVEILRAAWLRALHWVEDADLGNWKPTGAGQGWAAFRHAKMPTAIYHHGHPSLSDVERDGAWAGRCEAWKWGKLPAGPWTEYDLTCCYTRIAEDCAIPVRWIGHVGPAGAQKGLDGSESAATLARVIVSTDVPVAPARSTWGVWWPVGTFSTVLWDHEARAVVAAGGFVQASEGWRYRTAPALREWAGWILDLLDADPADLHPTLRLVVKGWARSVVGRFGSRWSRWEHYGDPIDSRVTLADAYDATRDASFRLLSIGDRTLYESEKVDAPDSAVFVMSWIMAEARVRLWRIMNTAGLANVAYVDTDSVLVNRSGAEALELAGLPGLRPKGSWSNVEILGPRQLILSGKLRASGVPSKAVQTGRKRWEAEVWRSLPGSIRNGELDRVVISDRAFNLSGTDRRRRHIPDGITAPFVTALD